MANVDFSIVRQEIARAAREVFDLCRAKHPAESFYAFDLCSEDGAMATGASAITEESLRRLMQRVRHEPTCPEYGVERSYYRWGLAEGVYEDGNECFHQVYQLINVEERYDNTAPDAFGVFKGKLFAAMVLALKDLDAAGCFGAGDARERVTLLCSVKDSTCHDWLRMESASRLNPDSTFERYWQEWTKDPTIHPDRGRGVVYQAFLQHLKNNG